MKAKQRTKRAKLVIEMPERCTECPCSRDSTLYRHWVCDAVEHSLELPNDNRPDWCPLELVEDEQQ